MQNTVIAENIGQSDNAYALLAIPSTGFKKQVSDLLDSIVAEINDVIWPMPSNALHITLCEIIQPKLYSEDKQALYDRHKVEYEMIPEQVLSSITPITVRFNTIEVNSQAIIVRGEDGGVFNKVRDKLVESLPIPDETKKPPDIVHSSIARYQKSEDIRSIQEACRELAIDFEEVISEVQLVHNARPPMLEYQVIRSYPLSK